MWLTAALIADAACVDVLLCNFLLHKLPAPRGGLINGGPPVGPNTGKATEAFGKFHFPVEQTNVLSQADRRRFEAAVSRASLNSFVSLCNDRDVFGDLTGPVFGGLFVDLSDVLVFTCGRQEDMLAFVKATQAEILALINRRASHFSTAPVVDFAGTRAVLRLLRARCLKAFALKHKNQPLGTEEPENTHCEVLSFQSHIVKCFGSIMSAVVDVGCFRAVEGFQRPLQYAMVGHSDGGAFDLDKLTKECRLGDSLAEAVALCGQFMGLVKGNADPFPFSFGELFNVVDPSSRARGDSLFVRGRTVEETVAGFFSHSNPAVSEFIERLGLSARLAMGVSNPAFMVGVDVMMADTHRRLCGMSVLEKATLVQETAGLAVSGLFPVRRGGNAARPDSLAGFDFDSSFSTGALDGIATFWGTQQ